MIVICFIAFGKLGKIIPYFKKRRTESTQEYGGEPYVFPFLGEQQPTIVVLQTNKKIKRYLKEKEKVFFF